MDRIKCESNWIILYILYIHTYIQYIYIERYERFVTTEKSKKRFLLRFHGRKVIDGSDDWYREPIRYPRDITQTHLEKLLIPYIRTLDTPLRCYSYAIRYTLGYVSGISLTTLNSHSRALVWDNLSAAAGSVEQKRFHLQHDYLFFENIIF